MVQIHCLSSLSVYPHLFPEYFVFICTYIIYGDQFLKLKQPKKLITHEACELAE